MKKRLLATCLACTLALVQVAPVWADGYAAPEEAVYDMADDDAGLGQQEDGAGDYADADYMEPGLYGEGLPGPAAPEEQDEARDGAAYDEGKEEPATYSYVEPPEEDPGEGFDSPDEETRKIWFENLWFDDQDETCAHIFNEGNYTLQVNVDELEEKTDENFSVLWSFGCLDADGSYEVVNEETTSYGDGEEGNILTVNGTELYQLLGQGDRDHFSVRAIARIDGDEAAELAECWLDLTVSETEEEYDLPEEAWYGLPGWWFGIDKHIRGFVRDAEHPYGEEVWTELRELSLELNDGTAEDAIVVEPWDDGNGWTISANRMGSGKLTMLYTMSDGESAPCTMDVMIDEDVWTIWITPSTGADTMLPGASIDLLGKLEHDCYDPEEDRHYDGDTNVEFEWELDDDAEEIFTPSFGEDPLQLTLKATDDIPEDEWELSGAVTLRAWLLDEAGGRAQDEEGHDIEVVSVDMRLYIRHSYGVILPKDLPDSALLPGKTMEYTPEYHGFMIGEDGEQEEVDLTDEVQFRWEWDEAAVRITDATGKELTYGDETGEGAYIYGVAPFTIERLRNYGTDLRVVADTRGEEPEQMDSRGFYLDEAELDVRFEDDLWWDEDGVAHIFDEGTYRIGLNTEGLGELEDYTIAWQVGHADDRGHFYNEFDEGYTVNDDASITVDGAWLANHRKEDTDGVNIRAAVLVGGEEVRDCWLWLRIYEPVMDYNFDINDWPALPGWTMAFEKEFRCYVEDAEHPYGEDVTVRYTAAELENLDGTDKEVARLVESDDDNCWFLIAREFGHARLKLYYTDPSGAEVKEPHTCEIWVIDDVCQMELETDPDTGEEAMMVPGGSLVLTPVLRRYQYENERQYRTNIDVEYIWTLEEGAEDLFTIRNTDDEWGSMILEPQLESVDGESSGRVAVRAFALDEKGERAKDEEGNDIEVAYADRWVHLARDYYNIRQEDLKEALWMEGHAVEYFPVVERITPEGAEDVTDQVYFTWDYDPENVQILDADGKDVADGGETAPFTLIRKEPYPDDLTLHAYFKEEDYGKPQHSRTWHLDMTFLEQDGDGIWKTYNEKDDFVPRTGMIQYGGEWFFVANGVLCSDANGLNLFDGTWYFLANGMVQRQANSLALYDGEWFKLKNGILDTEATGLVSYDGGLFLFSEGRLNPYSGLFLNASNDDVKFTDPDGKWYFLADGQVQTQYSGVAVYDGAFFVIENGVYQNDYNGTIEYDGHTFNVVNGQLMGEAAGK